MQRITEEAFKIEIRGIIKSLRRYQPLKVILFGSFARGDFHAGSDIDLLIVKETDLPFTERPAEVLRLCQYTLPLEPLVYTPGELERMCREENAFILSILREGVVLYESKPNRRRTLAGPSPV